MADGYVVDVTVGSRSWTYVSGEPADQLADTWLADGATIGWRRALERHQPEPMTCSLAIYSTVPVDQLGVVRGAQLRVEVWPDVDRVTPMATFYGRLHEPKGTPELVGRPARHAIRYELSATDYLTDLNDIEFDGGAYSFSEWPEGGKPLEAIMTEALVKSGRWPSDRNVHPTAVDPDTGEPETSYMALASYPDEHYDIAANPLVDGTVYNLGDLAVSLADLSATAPGTYPDGYPDLGYRVLEPWVDPATGAPHTASSENYGLVVCPVLDRRTPPWWVPPYTLELVGGMVQLNTAAATPAGTWVVPAEAVDTGLEWTHRPGEHPSTVVVIDKNTAGNDRTTRVTNPSRAVDWDEPLHLDGRDWLKPYADRVSPTLWAQTFMPDVGSVPGSAWSADTFTVRADWVPGLLEGAPWVPDHARLEPQEAAYYPNRRATYYDYPGGPLVGPGIPYRRHACYEAPVIVEGMAPGWHPDQLERYVGLLTGVSMLLAGGHIDVTFGLVRRHPLAYQPDGSGHPVQAVSYADVLADPVLAPTTYAAWGAITATDARLAR